MISRSVRLFVLFAAISILPTVAHAENFFASLSGAQENPSVATNATGYARVFVNESTGMLSFTLVFNGLTSNQTASHIHTGVLGVNGPVTIDLGAVGGMSGTITGTRSITPAQIASMRQHGMYVNVHTTNFPGGEIRGQLGIKRPVDFDGDGRQDYSVLKFPSAGDPRPITYWNLNSTTGTQISPQWGNALTDFPTPGDYDGDGRDDLAIYRAGAVSGAQSEFWVLNSSNNVVQYFAWGLFGDQAVARDYDGDGITDVAVYRRGATATSQGTWYIRRSSNNTAQVVGFGLTGNGTTSFDTPIPGDYDGDGKFDIAVYRFGQAPVNTYIILRSSDSAITYQQFGNFNTDYILPGDYDGDGKFDLAVARTGATGTSPMVWWILQSSNGQTRTQTFGISADIPVQGDYDGDARTDIAVFRDNASATGPTFFWVLNSFSNTAQPTQWGVGADFPLASFDAR